MYYQTCQIGFRNVLLRREMRANLDNQIKETSNLQEWIVDWHSEEELTHYITFETDFLCQSLQLK